MGSGGPLQPFPPPKSPSFPCECSALKVIYRLSIPRGMPRLSASSPGPGSSPTPAKRQQGIQEAEARVMPTKRDRPYEILPDEPTGVSPIMTVSAKHTRSFPSGTSVESRLLPWQCGSWMQADEQRPPPRRAKKAASQVTNWLSDRSFRLLLPLLPKLSD